MFESNLPYKTTSEELNKHLIRWHRTYAKYSYKMFLKRGKGMVLTNYDQQKILNNEKIVLQYCPADKYLSVLNENKILDELFFRLLNTYNPNTDIFLAYQVDKDEELLKMFVYRLENLPSPKDIYNFNYFYERN